MWGDIVICLGIAFGLLAVFIWGDREKKEMRDMLSRFDFTKHKTQEIRRGFWS